MWMDTPWLYGGAWSQLQANNSYKTFASGTLLPTYVEETQVCYGTYLPASTAQVRRCYTNDLNSKYSGTLPSCTTTIPTFTVANLYFVGQQIILPDDVTAGIVKMAVSGDISLYAHSCRNFQVSTQASLSQSIILPIKIASANSLFVLFQNTSMNENPYYLSCTRNCPFSSLQWQPTTQGYFVGSETSPILQGVNTLSPFSIQLRLGNEQIPMQPIQDVPTLVYKLQRAIHAVADMDYSVPTVTGLRHNRTISNITSTSNNITNGGSTTEYMTLKNGDFLTPYVPIIALDDQTITDNLLFKDYPTGVSSTTIDSSLTLTGQLSANNRGTYVLPQFLPPTSKFMLGFDLETFPNQSEVARSGRYLGNGTITLQLSNTYACANSAINGQNDNSYTVIAVVLHDIRFSIIAGGQILAYY